MKSNALVIVIFLFVSLGISCKTKSKTDQSFIVEYKGALKNIMHKGDLSAKTNLSEYKNVANLYALGAIEDLKGEIQIFNSTPYNSYVENGAIKMDTSFSKSAALFVKSVVTDWHSIEIPNAMSSASEFEKYLKMSAAANDIDINQAFPFKLEGTAAKIDWHVIDWKEGDTEHSHEKHITSGLHGTLENVPVEMLGFYSNAHHAIFTHHTTNIHMHMKLKNNKIAGHVDDYVLGQNMILKLPKND